MATRHRFLFCVSALLYYSGSMRLIHWLHRRSCRRLLIVNYHQASGEELRRHLLYLRKHFQLQFVDQALETLYTGDENKAPGKDRRLLLAVTFDDGYADNYTHAYALARELQIPITIFLTTDYIEKGAAFWWFDHLVERAGIDQVTIDGHTYHINLLHEQLALAQFIDAELSSIADKESRREYLRRMSEALFVPFAEIGDADDEAPARMLTWEQVHEMQASGWVAFGGHTLHHPTLSTLTDACTAHKEVAGCRSMLQEKLGLSARVFAYPHGGIEAIGPGGIQAVKYAGYRWAVTTIPGVNTPHTHPYLIRRISANSQLHFLFIVLFTSGVWNVLTFCKGLFNQVKYRKLLQEIHLLRKC